MSEATASCISCASDPRPDSLGGQTPGSPENREGRRTLNITRKIACLTSRRFVRASAAVVRSLTLTRQIPLRPLPILGVGAVQPVAENRVRAGRGEPLQTGGAKPG